MKNLAGLMKQASQMQAKMEALEIEGTAGGGMLRVTITGKSALKRVHIDPKLIDPAETEMLADLIVAAHADAKRKLDDIQAAEMQDATGGIALPDGFKLPF